MSLYPVLYTGHARQAEAKVMGLSVLCTVPFLHFFQGRVIIWVIEKMTEVHILTVSLKECGSMKSNYEGESISNLSHFRRTKTVTIFMPCFNTCFIRGYKIACLSSHPLIRY